MPYATEADLEALVQADIPAATATLLLELASGAVDGDAGRPLTSAEYDETLTGAGTRTLWVDWPLTAVTSVTVDGDLLVDGVDYTWSRSGWITRTGGVWPVDADIDVTYTAGFADGSPELSTAKRITLEVAARVAANPQQLQSLTTDGVAATFGPGLGLDDAQRRDVKRLQSRRRRA